MKKGPAPNRLRVLRADRGLTQLDVSAKAGIQATRYHSLVIERESMPDCLEVTAWTDDGEIMGVRHKTLKVEGVQFHPESVLTPEGPQLIGNFLKMIGGRQ